MNNILERFSLAGKKALIVCPENPYSREIAAGLTAAGAEIWTAGNVDVDLGTTVVGKFNYLNVKLVCNYRDKALVGRVVSLYVHLCDGLAVLDSRSVSCRTAENYYVNHAVHVIFKRGIDKGLVSYGEVAQMNGYGR